MRFGITTGVMVHTGNVASHTAKAAEEEEGLAQAFTHEADEWRVSEWRV